MDKIRNNQNMKHETTRGKSDFEILKSAIESKKIGSMVYELEDSVEYWMGDLGKTGIAKFLNNNDHLVYRDTNVSTTISRSPYKGAFMKLDENTFVQFTLLNSKQMRIDIFPKEEVKKRIHEAYFDWDNPENEKGMDEKLLSLKEFKGRREQLKDIANGKREFDVQELTTDDLKTLVEMYFTSKGKNENGKNIYEIGQIPMKISMMPKFEQLLIEYVKNNPKSERLIHHLNIYRY